MDTEGQRPVGYDYKIALCNSDGTVIGAMSLLDKANVQYDTQAYSVTDPSLYQTVEALECAT